MSWTCTNCGADVPDGVPSCASCGMPAPPEPIPGDAASPDVGGTDAAPDVVQSATTPQQEYEAQYAAYLAEQQVYEQQQAAQVGQQQAYEQQQYEAQQAAYDAQQQPAGPQQPKSKKSLFIGLGIAAALLACGGCAIVSILILSSGGGSNNYEAWQPTRDQQRVVAEFGYPESFAIYYGSDPADPGSAEGGQPVHRVEVWDYYGLNSRFTFKDGVATGAYDAPALPAGAQSVQASPLDFSLGMSVEEVANALGSPPTEAFDIAPDAGEGLELYGFSGQVVAGFAEGALMSIETVPVVIEGGDQ